jgi:hypothetical protein
MWQGGDVVARARTVQGGDPEAVRTSVPRPIPSRARIAFSYSPHGCPGRGPEHARKGGEMAERRRVVGIDISRAWLDVASWPEGAGARLANDPGGYRALLAWLAQQPAVDESHARRPAATSGPWLPLCSKRASAFGYWRPARPSVRSRRRPAGQDRPDRRPDDRALRRDLRRPCRIG